MSDSEGPCGDPESKEVSGVGAVPEGEEKKQEEPLGPYQPDNPVGKDTLFFFNDVALLDVSA